MERKSTDIKRKSLKRTRDPKDNTELDGVPSRKISKTETKRTSLSEKKTVNKRKQLKATVSKTPRKTKAKPFPKLKSGCVQSEHDSENLASNNGNFSSETSCSGFNDHQREISAVEWTDESLLAEFENLDPKVASNVIKLFEEENTIPFIARYRQHMTGQMEAEQLRKVKESIEKIKEVRRKAQTFVTKLRKQGTIDETLFLRIRKVRSLEELNSLTLPFKETKRTRAQRAKDLGLECHALHILFGSQEVHIDQLVNPQVKELSTPALVEGGIKDILADIISKDEVIWSEFKNLKSLRGIKMRCDLKDTKNVSSSKYKNYHNFEKPIMHIKEHNILAINRGEDKKELAVKVIIPEDFWNKIRNLARMKWLNFGKHWDDRHRIFKSSLEDSIRRFLNPAAVREVRAFLTETAEIASINLFAKNVKILLTERPFRGKPIMAIDPGTRICKVAVISGTGRLLDKGTISHNDSKCSEESREKLKNMLKYNTCETIAIGNGKGGRDTEIFISEMINEGWFYPLEVSYTTINEQAASLYSTSAIAKEELPDVPEILRSAVFLARRLQDPLSELVKVEPENLGVGQYQHDMPKKKLVATLNEVISECVSFIGVDINTASKYLLRRLAGLSDKKAENIISWRSENGPFKSRDQLKNVKNIGNKSFIQCAGFIRIIPATAGLTEKHLNPLDRTWIHPESYNETLRIIKHVNLDINDLGKPEFIERVKNLNTADIFFTKEWKGKEISLKFILEALSKPTDYDLRSINKAPLFRKEITKLESLQVGTPLSGVVRNITDFGAFVDIGVGKDGLIHKSQFSGHNLEVNDKVEVLVISLDLDNKKIGLKLVSKK